MRGLYREPQAGSWRSQPQSTAEVLDSIGARPGVERTRPQPKARQPAGESLATGGQRNWPSGALIVRQKPPLCAMQLIAGGGAFQEVLTRARRTAPLPTQELRRGRAEPLARDKIRPL